jgi:hypothetical protein
MSTIAAPLESFGPRGLSRRGLLVGGSALIGALVLGSDLTPAPDGLQKLLSSGAPRIPIAFLEGSEAMTSLAAALSAGAVRAVPASAIAPASALAGEAVRMTVHGFTPGLGGQDTPFDSVYLDSLIPAPDAAHAGTTIPFYAWTYRRTPASSTGRSRFVIGSERGLRVGLSLSTLPAAAAANDARREAISVFTSGRDRDLPKLRPGVYLLGLDDGLWHDRRTVPAIDDPAWSGLGSMVLTVEALSPR